MPPAFALSQDQTLKFIPSPNKTSSSSPAKSSQTQPKPSIVLQQNENPSSHIVASTFDIPRRLTPPKNTSSKRSFKAFLKNQRDKSETLPIMTIRHVSLSKPSQQPNQPITIHQQPKPPMNPCTIKHTETPPTYPFPAYAIVKERYANSCPAFPRSQHKRHRFRYLMPTPSCSEERVLRLTEDLCQRFVTSSGTPPKSLQRRGLFTTTLRRSAAKPTKPEQTDPPCCRRITGFKPCVRCSRRCCRSARNPQPRWPSSQH